MRVAIIGSRNLSVSIGDYIPENMTELVSGGAEGIDRLAEAYADERSIPKIIYKPEYLIYGKRAPLERNKAIVKAADLIIAIWDGRSHGTKFTIDYARKVGKNVSVYIVGQVAGYLDHSLFDNL